MKFVTSAEWISYDKKTLYDGTIAGTFDSGLEIKDKFTLIYLIDAESADEAVVKLRRTPRWEVAPTHFYAVAAEPMQNEIQYVSREECSPWRYIYRVGKKERSESFAEFAAHLLAERNIDITQPVPLLELAKIMEEQTGCNRETAKRHIVKAARQARGELPAQRGGVRSGAGRPPKPA